jgi:hypothetical protein
MTTVKLPTTVETFKEALKRGIERFQGSPVNNKNKLNESTAVALEVGTQDVLAALEAVGSEVQKVENLNLKYNIDMAQGGMCFINGQAIHPDVNANADIGYSIVEREEMIDDILDIISEHKQGSRNRLYMRQTLDELYSTKDELIFRCVDDNEIVAKSLDVERFNELCEEMLEADREYEEE